jgi:hypothetical protein
MDKEAKEKALKEAYSLIVRASVAARPYIEGIEGMLKEAHSACLNEYERTINEPAKKEEPAL